ncbi:MAG: HemK2/MTQ2 family protein methyltransferase [Thermoplasmataceae archaeon]
MNRRLSKMQISSHGINIEVCPGVYPPAEDTFLVVDHATVGSTLLEIGSGSGFISIYYSKLGMHVTASDINPAAVACTRANAGGNNTNISVLVSDLFTGIRGKYDTIIFNPPYLPAADEVEDATQWNGGKDGFAVVRPFLDSAHKFLNHEGNIFIILSSLTDYQALELEYSNYIFELVASESFFFERIMLFSLKVK